MAAAEVKPVEVKEASITVEDTEKSSGDIKLLNEREKEFVSQFSNYLLKRSLVEKEFVAGGKTTGTSDIYSKSIVEILSRALLGQYFMGTSVRNAHQNYENYSQRQENKNILVTLPQKKKEALRNSVTAAVKIFRIFECQFANVFADDKDVNGNGIRAMGKLAEDAVDRVINYIVDLLEENNEEVYNELCKSSERESDFIFNAVLLGRSNLEFKPTKITSKILKGKIKEAKKVCKGSNVKYICGKFKVEMNTSELFKTCGYIVKRNDKIILYELKKGSRALNYGYKQLLPCDDFYKMKEWNWINYNKKQNKERSLDKVFVEYEYKLSLQDENIETKVNEIVKELEGKESVKKKDIDQVEEIASEVKEITTKGFSFLKKGQHSIIRMIESVGEEIISKSREDKVIMVSKKWEPLIGLSLPRITPNKYLLLQEIDERDSSQLITGLPIKDILPHVLQYLKMWGIWIIKPYILATFIAKPEQPQEERPEKMTARERLRKAKLQNINEDKFSTENAPFSRIDILTCLVNSCTCTIAEDLLRIMSQFPIALPLILPWVEEEMKFKLLIPWLQSANFKWETEKGIIQHNFLFSSPYRMITALRIGDASKGKPGKSCILNQLFSSNHLFSSANEPSANFGTPVSLPGLVEFVPLSQETCTDIFWTTVVENHYKTGSKDIILLANLHGDSLSYPETVELMKTLGSTFVVFLMEQDSNAVDDQLEALSILIGEEVEEDCILVVDSPEIGKFYKSENVIETSDLLNDATLEKVRNVIKSALEGCRQKIYQEIKLNATKKTITIATPIETPQSLRLVTFAKRNSCETIKHILKLQKTKTRYLKNFESYNQIWKNGIDLQNIMTMFIEIILVPLEERRMAVSHLHRELSNISNDETSGCRNEITKLLEKRLLTLNLKDQDNILQSNNAKINAEYTKLDTMNLGMEHLFRELGRVYEIEINSKEGQIRQYQLMNLPKLCAELLLDGLAIEILDGDIEDINGPWFNAICGHIHSQFPNLRVFVVSVLGLQSTGKSTLLNALFGCKFAVSAGRCTRGLFMRFLFLERKLVKRTGVDALILIDTEGLAAPEKMNEKDAERKDRLMATFAMSISDLTIVNVLGEALHDLTDILQIVIVTMARLDKVEMSPDILLVQYVSERDKTKTIAGADAFTKALQQAISLVSKKVMDLGTFECRSLNTLIQRVNQGDVLKQFRSFKNGASPNAPPSHEYHEDVVRLRNDILNCCEKNKVATSFNVWYQLLPQYWEEVLTEKFSLNFKNLKEIEDFIDRGKKMAKVQQSIDLAIREHVEHLSRFWISKANMAFMGKGKSSQTWESEKQKFFDDAKESLIDVPNQCTVEENPCEFCLNASRMSKAFLQEVKGRNLEAETQNTIKKYIANVVDTAIKQLKQLAAALEVKFEMLCGFEVIITKKLKEKLAENVKYGSLERQTIIDEIWTSLRDHVSEKGTLPHVIKRIKREVYSTYHDNIHMEIVFANLEYVEIDHVEGIVMQRDKEVFTGKYDTSLTPQQSKEIRNFLEGLPATIMKEKSAQKFENWMIKELFQEIEIYIENFQKIHNVSFKPDLMLKIHQNGLRLFCEVMEEKENAWKLWNDPLTILKLKEDDYKKQIDIRLRYGFEIDGEGRIMGNTLIKAIRARAQYAGDRKQVDTVLTQPWILNSENVRLAFLSDLATEVEECNKKSALDFFANPKKSIESWFDNKVNSFKSVSAEREFTTVAEKELKNVHLMISQHRNC